MKIKTYKQIFAARLLLFPIYLLSTTCTYEDIKKCVTTSKPLDTYSYYPYVPGTSEWLTLGNTDNLFKVSQLPEKNLKSISSSGLAQSLLDNPCLMLISAYSTYFIGRNAVLSRLNASFELNKREDGAIALVTLYNQKTPSCYPSNGSSLEQGQFIETYVLHEVVLSQDSILNQLNRSKKIDLTKILIAKYNDKIRLGFDFGTSRLTNLLVISQIMRLDGYAPYINELVSNAELFDYANAGSGYSYGYTELENKILSIAQNYIQI
ncbi:MAG: hypothetical protein ACKO1F_09815 [Flammeovirgaceae bacterium]